MLKQRLPKMTDFCRKNRIGFDQNEERFNAVDNNKEMFQKYQKALNKAIPTENQKKVAKLKQNLHTFQVNVNTKVKVKKDASDAPKPQDIKAILDRLELDRPLLLKEKIRIMINDEHKVGSPFKGA